MSHLSRIRLEFKNKASLIKALESFELRHEVKPRIKLEAEDIFIPCEQFGVEARHFKRYKQVPGIRFTLVENEYEMQTDTYVAFSYGSRLSYDFQSQLKKRYVEIEIAAQAQAMGFEVAGFITDNYGNTVATLTHGASTVQCLINKELTSVQMGVSQVPGTACMSVTAQLQAALGQLEEQNVTQEYYLDQNEVLLQYQQQIGGYPSY